MPRTNRPSASKNKGANGTAKTKNSNPYSRNFEQLLIDHGVFPPLYEYSNGRKPKNPKNLDEIRQRAKQRRPSLSPSRYTDKEFEEFQNITAKSSNEDHVSRNVIDIIEGSTRKTYGSSTKVKFANLQSLFDHPLTPGNPDLYDGAPPEQLDRRIRERLYEIIIPSTLETHHIVPNFFLHLKGPDGSARVAQRQCVYDGALGERSQHQLRSYGTNEPKFDNNAHTITSVYVNHKLSIYSVYTAQTDSPSSRQEYYTHLISSWAMDGDVETFQKGAAAFRNLREWAKEQRDEAIRLANSLVEQAEGKKNEGEEDDSEMNENEEDEGEENESEEDAELGVSDGVDSNNDQTLSPAKRPFPMFKHGRPSKRAKTRR